ncbi:alpha/beta hydrolase [Conexibacter stalactiti]|uniref:Alpha/beta hydrolase n=1 Tax=Conexibacter stalactiti TaxID=1940611 RepID=A0ABU4HLS2_9ACTN|nr:alpha/beta hydrolase [Conexibacter stalactiti]MDW5594234.1 alpha/beta hydrolase [Conexibacter stalactiti]MEC5034876.1 alpha/beta hydrolase [Conexibacter stalactiti]
MQPTIVLVHGAFAESASWNGVAERLYAAGHPVVAAANPLRGLAEDASAISDLVRTIEGPVVLAGHSYGGAVISNVDADAGDITALVYVGAFAPATGESCIELSQRFAGSTLGAALNPVPRRDGSVDLLIARDRFHAQFCSDVPKHEAGLMGATQRPIAKAALEEPTGPNPLWQQLPSFFIFGTEDHNIPATLQRSLAERANAHRTVEIYGASHAIAVSRPDETAGLILEAAHLHAAAA